MDEIGFIFDPELAVWDLQDYLCHKHTYWKLIEETRLMLDNLKQRSISPLINHESSESLMESFPMKNMGAPLPELRDYVRLLYATVTACSIRVDTRCPSVVSSTSPTLHCRATICQMIRQQFLDCLTHTFTKHRTRALVTNDYFLDVQTVNVHDASGTFIGQVIVCRDKNEQESALASVKRVYEPNPKHDAISGSESRLPIGLTDAELQTLLDGSIRVKKSNRFCVYSAKYATFLLFHEHRPFRYHAFPVNEQKLQQIGVDPSDLPII